MAKAAQLALGDRAVAVTGTSSSFAAGQLDEARDLAQRIGIRHEVIETGEFEKDEYVRNDVDRCYHCKHELYTQMEQWVDRLGVEVIVNGTNQDDLHDYRPGLRAASQHRVRSPLAECGMNKQDVRELARRWNLSVWNKPASPCLSSRVVYGVAVTPERLAMIDRAEQYLRQRGLSELRVRYHEGDLARIEVPEEAVFELCREATRKALVEHVLSLGFKFVTLDLQGFRSGSLNSLIQIKRKP